MVDGSGTLEGEKASISQGHGGALMSRRLNPAKPRLRFDRLKRFAASSQTFAHF